MTNTPLRMGAAEWISLLVLSALWGGSFFFVEIAIRALPPFTVVFLRVALGAVVLWSVALVTGARVPLQPGLWLSFAVMGLLNNVTPFALFAWGQTEIASGLAAILNATTPLFTVLVASTLLPDERATPLKLAGVALGFVGVVVMVGRDALDGLGAAFLAQLACLGAALCYAFAGVFGRRFARMGVEPTVTAAGQVTASAVILAPIVLFFDDPLSLAAPGFEVWMSIAGLAILSTGVAYVLYFRILAKAGATNLLLVTFLIPVSAILLGAMVLGERLGPEHAAGMVLIGAGLVCIDGRLLNRARRVSP